MTCDHCVRAVTDELTRLDGVSGVEIDLADGAATVTSASPLDDQVVRDAVAEAGYELVA
jgi:copper chaperone CopZ